jgi:hypothetical protein
VLCCAATVPLTPLQPGSGSRGKKARRALGQSSRKRKSNESFRFYVVSSNLARIETDNCEYEVKKKEKIPTAKAPCGSAFLVLRRSFFSSSWLPFSSGRALNCWMAGPAVLCMYQREGVPACRVGACVLCLVPVGFLGPRVRYSISTCHQLSEHRVKTSFGRMLARVRVGRWAWKEAKGKARRKGKAWTRLDRCRIPLQPFRNQ